MIAGLAITLANVGTFPGQFPGAGVANAAGNTAMTLTAIIREGAPTILAGWMSATAATFTAATRATSTTLPRNRACAFSLVRIPTGESLDRPLPAHLLASRVASKGSVVFRRILTITTIWGTCFRSNSNLSGSNRWSLDTVLAQVKRRGVTGIHPLRASTQGFLDQCPPVAAIGPGLPALCPIESEVSCFDSR